MSANAQVNLVAISTNFNTPIGIDHHGPTNQLLMSVNFSSGLPHNLELVDELGGRTVFSNLSGLTNELKIATAKNDDGMGMSIGGFADGTAFSGTGVAGEIVRVSPDGMTTQNPWVTLPGETGLMRGSLYVDRTGVWGGDLIAVTTAGGVYRITEAGVSTKLAQINTHLEGLITVPNDPTLYGPWAGKILIGAEAQTRFYTVDTVGNVANFNMGIKPEDIDLIPAGANFFGIDFGSSTLWGAPATDFAGMEGDLLVAQEFPGILWRVHWNNVTQMFEKTEIASRVIQWEHVTFSTAGVVEIEPRGACCDGETGVCLDGVLESECTGALTTWTEGATCDTLMPACVKFNEPPICSDDAVVSLWPPNHKFVTIDVEALAGVTDPDGDPVTIMITGITQDELINSNGDGNTSCDGVIVNATTAKVRSERKGGGNGRVYQIHYSADDGNGGTCSGLVTVTVPHDQDGMPAVDDGQTIDSLTCMPAADVNGDGTVSFADLTMILADWGMFGPDETLNWPDADANFDGGVFFSDITAVLGQWGAVSPN